MLTAFLLTSQLMIIPERPVNISLKKIKKRMKVRVTKMTIMSEKLETLVFQTNAGSSKEALLSLKKNPASRSDIGLL